jgi:uncharacterized protein YcbX
VYANTLNFITQRQEPKMQLIETILSMDGDLSVRVEGVMPLLHIGKIADYEKHEKCRVEVWEEKVEAYDCGNEISGWFSKFLGKDLRFVAVDPKAKRCDKVETLFYVPDGYVGSGIHFQDGFPIHLACESSLDELQTQITERTLTIRSFRPNVVVSGTKAFDEDEWGEISIGSDKYYNVKPCDRCQIPNIDPNTAKVYQEPRQTLRETRTIAHREKKDVKMQIFGINLLQKNNGSKIRVGDTLQVLTRKQPLKFVPFEDAEQ